MQSLFCLAWFFQSYLKKTRIMSLLITIAIVVFASFCMYQYERRKMKLVRMKFVNKRKFV